MSDSYLPPDAETVTPVPAASVILVRETSRKFEFFMARRHIKSDFAPDVYVFPGGKADPDDAVDPSFVTESPDPVLADRDEPEVGWTAIRMAAIRELFEECGLLLARRPDGTWADEDGRPEVRERLAADRHEVKSGRLTMIELARRDKLVFCQDELVLYSNWITPEVLTRRFDTFFFLARLPDNHQPRLADEDELTHAMWISPSNALARFRDGKFPLIFATERHLEQLQTFGSADQLFQSCRGRAIPTISPRWIEQNEARVFLIPGDENYDSARVR